MKIDAGKKSISYLVFFGCLLLLMVSFSGADSSKGIEESSRKFILNNLGQVITALHNSKTILGSLQNNERKINLLISEYHSARKHYKQIEFFIEFYSGFDAKFYINGPLVPKIEMEISNKPFLPQGFQVIEENLFGKDKQDLAILQNEYGLLLDKLIALKEYYSTIIIEHPKLAEAETAYC